MLFYRLYRPLGRVGTVIPRGDKFYLLNFVLPEKCQKVSQGFTRAQP